jgi:predicted phage-related endonuclease
MLTHDEWLAARRGTIGSSEAAAACGESQYKSALRLYAEKRGEIPDEFSGNERAKRRGHALEAFVLSEYELESGFKLLPTATEADRAEFERRITARGACEVLGWVESAGRPQVFLRSTRYPWMTATLDGAAVLPDGGLEIVEAKSLGHRQIVAWGSEESGIAPTDKRFQVLHALAVTDAASAALIAMIGADDVLVVRELAHAPTIPLAALVAVERRFAECVRDGIEPTWDESAHDDARAARHRLHPGDSGTTVVLPDDVLALHEEWYAVNGARLAANRNANELEKRQKALSNQIEAAMQGHTFGKLPDGSGTYVWKSWERRGHTVAPSSGHKLTFEERE